MQIGSPSKWLLRYLKLLKSQGKLWLWTWLIFCIPLVVGRKLFAFVKNERTNLNAMISTLMYVVSYDIMGLEESFNGSCFGHVFPKAC